MPELFGTDGLRGQAGKFPLDEKSVFVLGQALAELFREKNLLPVLVTGRDTRESGKWLEEVLLGGFISSGGQAVSAGVIPTPGISYLVRAEGFSAGVVISASHNPYQDNGIKIFSAEGTKIPEDWEEQLEKRILKAREKDLATKPAAVKVEDSFRFKYLEHLQQLFSASNPGKLKLVLDCANGASSDLAPVLFRRLGFEVLAINCQPDGKNINKECGSLHPETLQETVKKERADLGIAYDGDADRAIWVDEEGHLLHGDHTLYVQALSLKEKNRLNKNTVVATIMSNMGLELALAERGITMLRTKVGDKYVLEEMLRQKLNLGGEQSGHTIFLDQAITGDGLLTSLKMIEVMLEKGQKISALVEGFKEFPQVLLNVRVREKIPFSELPGYDSLVEEVKTALAGEGRLEVRYSGTEPLARIMVEGPEQKKIEDLARKLADFIKNQLG
jgi:phosphoglucosamine mutase